MVFKDNTRQVLRHVEANTHKLRNVYGKELIFLPMAWDYLEKFKTDCLKYKSENTIAGYVSDLKLFKDYYKDDFETLTRDKVELYKKHLQKKGLLATTINRKLVSIRRFIQYLGKTDLSLNFNFEFESLDYQIMYSLKNQLSFEEFERITKAAKNDNDKRALAIFFCLYLTGLRVSEMLTLRVNDLSKETVYIWGKGNKQRPIRMREELKTYLNEYVRARQHKADSKLFINNHVDTAINRFQVHKIIKHYAGKAKVKLAKAHAHNFRHLHAYILAKNGEQIDSIGKILGHKDINYTKIYTSVTMDELFATQKKIKIPNLGGIDNGSL